MEDKIIGHLTATETLGGKLSPSSSTISGSVTIPSETEYETFSGPYEITPGQTQVVLDTTSKLMVESVVIKPVPSNYGQIVWDGATLQVI